MSGIIIESNEGITINRFCKSISVAVGTIETNLFDLSTAGSNYVLESFIIKCPNPGMNEIELRLYTLVDDTETMIDDFLFSQINYVKSQNMIDMFGLAILGSKLIRLKAIATGGTHTVTGQYAYSETI